jgi:hypothetical protein
MRRIKLAARGPVYLMDRGFYAIDLIGTWLNQQARFVVRARQKDLRYDVVRSVGAHREITVERLSWHARTGRLLKKSQWMHGTIVEDALVRLGSSQRKVRPVVRLVHVHLKGGEQLVFVSSETDWNAEQIIRAYMKRWQIEKFHQYLKQQLGLAHLYSFHARGVEFLLKIAILLSILLLLSSSASGEITARLLTELLRETRRQLHISTPWKANTCSFNKKKRPRCKAKVLEAAA